MRVSMSEAAGGIADDGERFFLMANAVKQLVE